ncbi:glycosyltransferase [Acuticoccus kandeliae]|uniref:glycosyltransferase n=1 Tax=Acuticoccus kandeliae TaxID=2073160 RepID=UPI000D3E9B94|nr:glycosyltransferase [Acuticoccus kandeliae]
MAPTVFIVGGYVPNGGTMMAYEVGRILHETFGYDGACVSVNEHGPDNGIFTYPHRFPALSIIEMMEAAGPDDILLSNPSFSNNGFGLRFPGRKIMYVQDFKTFSLLDLYFDHYVSVSRVVRDFLARTYRLKTPIIPAYVTLPDEAPPAWEARPAERVLLHVKGRDHLARGIGERVADILRTRRPSIQLEPLRTEAKISHRDLIARLGTTRTLLSLVPAEGFGLTPLEAMGVGATVCGLDGIAGRDYMRHGRNALITRYGPVEAIADTVLTALSDPARAATIAKAGRRTAERFVQPVFEKRWRQALRAMGVRRVRPTG